MEEINHKNKIRIIYVVFILFFLSGSTIGQITTSNKKKYTDERDNKDYKLIEVGQLSWFAEDLKYETKTSNKYIREDKSEKYFYTNNQLGSLCPPPFRMPTTKEWEEAITALYGVRKTTHQKVKNNKSLIVKMDMDSTFFSNQKLNIQYNGWIEGGKHVEKASTTYWINEEGKTNYHIHFGEKAFSEHTHKKNIIGKHKKRRQFLVRCVCEKSALK